MIGTEGLGFSKLWGSIFLGVVLFRVKGLGFSRDFRIFRGLHGKQQVCNFHLSQTQASRAFKRDQ